MTLRAIALLAAVAALSACKPATIRPAAADPVPAQCDSMCLTPCESTAPQWRPINPSDPKAWDELGPQVVAPLRDQRDQCELKRKSCVQCLERLDKAGVITL